MGIDGSEVGVNVKGKYWYAIASMITIDAPVATIQVRKYFSFQKHGGKEAALLLANAWRKKHCLREGMIWI